MNALKSLPIFLLATCVVGYYSRYREVKTNEISSGTENDDEEEEAEDVMIEDFSHPLGLDSLLHSHQDEPSNLFHALLDDGFDQYENVTQPKQKGDSVVKIRKPQLTISPNLRKVLIDYLRDQKNPELDQLIIDFRLEQD